MSTRSKALQIGSLASGAIDELRMGCGHGPAVRRFRRIMDISNQIVELYEGTKAKPDAKGGG